MSNGMNQLSASLLFSNLVLKDAVFYQTSSRVACAVDCLRLFSCSSFYYDSATYRCHLAELVYIRSSVMTKRNEMKYYSWRNENCRLDFTYSRAASWCFKHLGYKKSTWYEYVRICKRIHAQPIKIDTKEKDYIVIYLTKLLGHTWTGGSKILFGGYSWYDGSPLVYTNWYPGQPAHQYVVVYKMPDRTAWHAGKNKQKYETMCETV